MNIKLAEIREQNRAVITIKYTHTPAAAITPPPTLTPTPPPTPPTATCVDGIRNQGEQGVDCGGPCPIPCVEIPAPVIPPEKPSYLWLYILITLIVLAILGGIGFVFYEKERAHKVLHEEKKQTTLEENSLNRLQSYINQTLEEGYTEAQIRQRLVSEGWNMKVLNDIFKKVK